MKEKIEKILRKALFYEDELSYNVYELDLEKWKMEMKSGTFAFALAISVRGDEVAMLIIDKEGTILINERAREMLMFVFEEEYEAKMEMLLPPFIETLMDNVVPIIGCNA